MIIRLSIFNSIVKGLMVSLSFFLAIYLKSIGFSGTQIGIVVAIATITSIITILPSGFSNDSFKSKYLMTAALILLGSQFILLTRTNNFNLIAIIFLIGGIGTTLYSNSSDSLFHKITQKEQVSRKIGIFQGFNYLMIGISIITAGILLNFNIPFKTLFLAIGIGFLIMAIIGTITLPQSDTTKFEIIHYKKNLFQPKVSLFILIVFLFAIHFGAEQTSYGLFLEEYLKISRFQMGLYMGIAIMIMGPSVILISRKLKKFQVKNMLLFGLLISGLGHILMTTKIVPLSFAFRVIHEIADAAMLFFMYYGINTLFELKRIGGNVGIFQLTSSIGGTIGALIFGPIGMKYGYNIPLIISGIVMLLAFLIALNFIHHFKHE